MDPIVIDPGHGGGEQNGKSSPTGVVGPGGTREKDLALELARRVCDVLATLGTVALLTRHGDENPSLRERIFFARSEDARAFVSLHFNLSPHSGRGCEVWVHEDAREASEALAEGVLAELERVVESAAPGILKGPLAVLDPHLHDSDTAACLVEVTDLADTAEEQRLKDPAYLDSIAQAIARGVVAVMGSIAAQGADEDQVGDAFSTHMLEEEFDVWHEVPLVYQTTGMSCWAAAAAMLVGWRDCVDVQPEQVAHASGRWEAYRDGLTPRDVDALADAWGLIVEPTREYTVASLRRLLLENGPLWVGEASPGLHVVVLTGMSGDGTPEGTWVRVADPWPVGRGERYSITFAEWKQRLTAAAGLSGRQAQVLHTGGGGASRMIFERRREVQVFPAPVGGEAGYGAPVRLLERLPITDARPVPETMEAVGTAAKPDVQSGIPAMPNRGYPTHKG